MNNIDLKNRCAVVTGGAQGIGRAVAERFIGSGAQVTIWDQDGEMSAATAKELGIHSMQCDVTDQASVEAAASATMDAMGTIDILICNAGISGLNTITWQYPVDEWRRVLDIDLTGVFLCCRTVVPLMIDAGYGRIVNVASIAGKEGNPNAVAYSSAKAGVIALTKSLGKELADKNIAVNCVTPAAARTRIFDQMTEDHINYMLSKVPRGRFITVEEVAATIAFAASEDCSFTTGAVFDLSGGRATY